MSSYNIGVMPNHVITNKIESIVDLSPLKDLFGNAITLKPGASCEVDDDTYGHEIMQRMLKTSWITEGKAVTPEASPAAPSESPALPSAPPTPEASTPPVEAHTVSDPTLEMPVKDVEALAAETAPTSSSSFSSSTSRSSSKPIRGKP